MEKELTDFLIEALIGKKIKIYKFKNENNPDGGYYLYATKKTDEDLIFISEMSGTIVNLSTYYYGYDGDDYNFDIIDDEGKPLIVYGLNSITSKIEFLN
jgi:hypothetical protein